MQLNKIALIDWTVIIFVSSLFIAGMVLVLKELKNLKYKSSFIAILTWTLSLIAFTSIAMLNIIYYKIFHIYKSIIVVGIIVFLISYKKIEKAYLFFERVIVKYLKDTFSKEIIYDKLAPWDKYLVEVKVSPLSYLINKPLKELKIRDHYGINIVAIMRENACVFAPNGYEMIRPLDKLILLGIDDQLEEFKQKAQPILTDELEDHGLLKNISLKKIKIKNSHPALGKSIKDFNIRDLTNGIAVGIERNRIRILNPVSDTILKENDFLLVLGRNNKLKEFA